ncbi:hypothetical protein [Corynebacterium minutissimum]|uniref:hypothetical protein n=1 Tax=Corynebacterium minutissimum TaxID=38301 RepID=UPI001EF24B22|nr:hypothetical protein [Corynebacterium minutissimum]MCG7229126.1 hypothetical protein [Corynebacterium minutissimum]MCG7239548.1 hypothetical protein [Corynebacterium minutissimum]
MTNPFDSNPFEESAEPFRGRGANPFAEPTRQDYAEPSVTPSVDPFAEPQRSNAPAPLPDYAPVHSPEHEEQSTGGRIHRFSIFKGVLSLFSFLIGFAALTSGDVLFGVGFGLPGAWYFIKALEQKTNPTTPQKRHWFVIWFIAILLVIIGT